MRKLILIFNALLIIMAITACGSGGGSDNDSSSAGNSELGAIEEQGSVSFKFISDDALGKTTYKVLPDASVVRVLIESATAGFRFIQDYSVPATVADTITVPIANDYVVSAFSRDSGKILLKFGETTGVSVAAGVDTPVSLTLAPIVTSITTPASLTSGETYSATLSQPSPLQNFMYVATSTTPFVAVPSFPQAGGGNISLTAPAVMQSSTLYFMGKWYLDGRFLILGQENSSAWTGYTFYYPDINQQEGQVSVPLEPVVSTNSGSITATITFKPGPT